MKKKKQNLRNERELTSFRIVLMLEGIQTARCSTVKILVSYRFSNVETIDTIDYVRLIG